MGQKGNKWNESVQYEDLMWVINNAPIKELYPIAKLVCSADYAVAYYHNKKHTAFYHNNDAFRKALRRCLTVGAFNHRAIMAREFEQRDLLPDSDNT